MVDVVVGGGCVEGEGNNGGLYIYMYIYVYLYTGGKHETKRKREKEEKKKEKKLEGWIRKVSSAMGRRETKGVRMIGAATCRQIAAPQVLVGEGQRQ